MGAISLKNQTYYHILRDQNAFMGPNTSSVPSTIDVLALSSIRKSIIVREEGLGARLYKHYFNDWNLRKP